MGRSSAVALLAVAVSLVALLDTALAQESCLAPGQDTATLFPI